MNIPRCLKAKWLRAASRPVPATIAFLLASAPAYAQAMNFQTGVITLVTALLVVMGAIVILVAAYRGVEAVANERSVMPALLGLIFGFSFVFGGAWYLQQLGAGGANVGAIMNL